MAVTPLSLNNGNNPAPAATNTITLREFNGGPIAQPDAEANFINLTDRINALISDLGGSGGGAVINANLDVTGVFKAGEDANGIPAIDLTYPAGPRLRGGAQGVMIITDNQDANWNSIDSTTSNAGLTCSKITIRGGNGPPNSPAGVDSTTSLLHDSDGLRITPFTNNSSNPERVLIEGDLKVSGKIVTDQEVEDSTGNAVGGAGVWNNHWLDINVPSAAKQFGPSGTGVYDVNFHTHVPGALEVLIEAHMGEAYLQYWNVYTGAWHTVANAPDNYGANGGVCIRLSPGYYDPTRDATSEITTAPSTLQVIDPGTVKFRAFMAAGDEATADVIWVKIRRWR